MLRHIKLLSLWFCIIWSLTSVAHTHNHQCDDDDPACLQSLRDTLTRTDLWFGDAYSTTCLNGTDVMNFACLNPDPNHKTIIARSLQNNNFNIQNITILLHIRFYVPEGSYRACGHTFNVPATYMSQDVQLSDSATLDTWTMQMRPAIRWTPASDGVYTLASYNVDIGQLTGLWVNIKGGDSALGIELYPYNGPSGALNRTSFHVFILYQQNGNIDGRQLDLAKQSLGGASTGVMINRLVIETLLGQSVEAIGAGLIPTGADPYGIERHKTLSLHNSCPWLIARMRPMLRNILDVYNLQVLGADPNYMEVEVEVIYTSEAITFTSCCSNVTENARNVWIDPLNKNPVNPVYLRSTPFVKLGAVNMLDTNFFLNKLYTIVLLDVSWATLNPPLRQTSLLWHVINIPGQQVSLGLTQKEYTQPLPPIDRSINSLYTFFVFRQSGPIVDFSYKGLCNNADTNAGICDFNLHKFVMENNLYFGGVNWVWSQQDLYSRMKSYEMNSSKMDSACQGVPGYGRPCPDRCTMNTDTTPASIPVLTTPKKAGGKSGGNGSNSLSSADNGLICTVFIFIYIAYYLNDAISPLMKT